MSIQIFILGKIIEQPTYPYELKRQISDPIPLDELSGLTESKLYYHFENLRKKGLITEDGIIKEVNRPDKHMYAITEEGKAQLPRMIYKLFENHDDINDLIVGIINLKYVDNDRIIQILNKKIEKREERWQQLTGFKDQTNASELLISFLSKTITQRYMQTTDALKQLITLIEEEKIS